MVPKPGQHSGGASWGEVPGREVQERAAVAHRELDDTFAAKRIEALRAKRMETREVSGERAELVSAQISGPVMEDPPLRVNLVDPVNRGEWRRLQGKKLFLACSPKSPEAVPGAVSEAKSQEADAGLEQPVETIQSQEVYDDLFADEQFLAVYDEFSTLDDLQVRDSLQQAQYDKLKKIVEDILAKYNPPLTLDSPEFLQFRSERKQSRFNDSVNQLLSDPEFLLLSKELEDLYSRKELTVEEQARLAEVEQKLSEYIAPFGLQFNREAFKEFFKEQKKVAIYQEIDKLKDTDPELYYWAYAQLAEIDNALKDGRISEEEAEILSNEVLQKVIKASNDKKLKSMYADYSGKQEVSATSFSSGVEAARSYFEGSGLVLTSSTFGGGCSVETTDSTNFSCEISVDKDENGNFTYTIDDPLYANDGVDGPHTAEKLAEAVDSRHMDVFLTKELRKAGLDAAGDVGNTPDSQIIDVCKSLIGPGKDRGYKLEGMYLDIIHGLIEVLKRPDSEYSTTGRKIYALSLFLRGEDKSRVDKVRGACLPGDKATYKAPQAVSSIIGIKLEDLEREADKKDA